MNIVLLSSIYPAEDIDKRATPVVHQFAREWVKLGHNVLVIHSHTIYSRVFYLLLNIFKSLITNFVGSVVEVKRLKRERLYVMDGVKVIRIPIFKYIPKYKFLDKMLDSQSVRIKNILEVNHYYPDLIIGHWVAPQLYLLNVLKSHYSVKTALVIHELSPEIIKRNYGKNGQYLLDSVDIIGFRSKSIQLRFENCFGVRTNSFICYSGVSEDLICREMNKEFPSSEILSFVFVGTLIKRKYPMSVISALKTYSAKADTVIHYVGDGPLKSEILKAANNFGNTNNVLMHGYLSKDKVVQILDQCHCFIMISEKEAFGLVYIEAMSRGCITVASKNEGMDGIIIDGKNGFLCEAGNVNELKGIIDRINCLSAGEKAEISRNAVLTAIAFAQKKVSIDYLNSVVGNLNFK